MQYVRIHTGPDGHTHFQDVQVEMQPGGGGGSALSAPVPISGVVFARRKAGFSLPLHNAPRRQFVVMLAGTVEMETAGGESRRFEAGSVALAEDTTGTGHTLRGVGADDWYALWLPLPGEAYTPSGTAPAGMEVGRYVRIHPTADGGSAFEDVTLPAAGGSGDGGASELIPATNLIFRRSPPEYDIDWHNAPRRQFVVNLTGAVEIVASDGQSRRLGAGTLLRAEDITGKGHLSRNAGDGERLSLFVPLAD